MKDHLQYAVDLALTQVSYKKFFEIKAEILEFCWWLKILTILGATVGTENRARYEFIFDGSRS